MSVHDSAPPGDTSGGSLEGHGIGVSGGGTHLGRAIALALASAGARVVIFGRREAPLEQTAMLARTLPGEVFFEVANQHLDEDLERVLDRVEKEAGRVHGWVNNACGGASETLMCLERASVEKAIEGTLSDSMLAAETAAKRMISGAKRAEAAATGEGARIGDAMSYAARGAETGAIVNIASMYGLVSPQPDTYQRHPQFHNPPAYGAAKAGLIQFTRYAACHLGAHGIRVNCVSPGPFPTAEIQREEGFVAELEQRVPLGRIGRPAEMGGPVAFLLSPMASYVTGHNLVVDGGWTTW